MKHCKYCMDDNEIKCMNMRHPETSSSTTLGCGCECHDAFMVDSLNIIEVYAEYDENGYVFLCDVNTKQRYPLEHGQIITIRADENGLI